MKKELATKRIAGKTTAHTKRMWWWVMILAVLVLVISAGSFFVYKKRLPVFPVVSAYVMRVKTWIAERKVRLHQGITKVKQIAVNKNEAEPAIHFEFYTALPNMQVTIPDTQVRDNQASRNVNQAKRDKPKTTKKLAIISAEQVDHELATEFIQNQYIKQRGE